MKLIALTNIKFKGERIAQDEKFDAPEKDAAALIADGLAKRAEASEPEATASKSAKAG